VRHLKAGLNQSDISAMIREVRAYRDRFVKRCEDFCRRLADEGSTEASRVYGSDIKVSAVPIENGFSVMANGKQVCFLEFGAGTKTNTSHPMAGNFTAATGNEVRPGSYSEQNAQEFSTFGFWVFPPNKDGKVYEYVEPQPGLWRAEQRIVDIVERIAQEVFR